MILRIRLPRGRPIERRNGKNRHVALAFGALLTPLALMAYVLGLWRLASDMGFASAFVINGLFSHWQVWIFVGLALQTVGSVLNRYGRGGGFRVPQVLTFYPRVPKPPEETRKVSSR